MMDQIYYNDIADVNGAHYNFKDIFLKQKDLCEKNLQLQPSGINNLTLRLCLAQHSFCDLFKQTLSVRQVTRLDYEFKPQLSNHSTSGVARLLARPSRELGNAGEIVDLNLHNVHEYFFSFCTFAVSVLDRLAVEIKECYGLTKVPERQVDWGYFFDSRNYINWTELTGYSIYSVLKNPLNTFLDLRIMRNNLSHRNFFDIKSGAGGNDFDYIIEGNKFLTGYIKDQMTKLLYLCNFVYEAIYNDSESTGFEFPILASKKVSR